MYEIKKEKDALRAEYGEKRRSIAPEKKKTMDEKINAALLSASDTPTRCCFMLLSQMK